MPRLAMVACVLGVAALGVGREASTEERSDGWDGNVFLSVNGASRPASGGFGYRDVQIVFQEEASAQATFARRGAPTLEIAAGVHLWGHLGIGACLSGVREHQPTTLTVIVPHPLLFNHPATGSIADSSSHSELALHLPLVLMTRLSPRVRLGLFGGPSHFWLHQQVVSDADLDPTFLPGQVFSLGVPRLHGDMAHATAWGFHVGGDLTLRVSKWVGIGGFVRYSRATAHVANALTASRTGDGTKTVPIGLGGLQVGGGLKAWF